MELQLIPIANLSLAFIPVVAVIAVMSRWGVGAGKALYANARMLVQLVAIGYVLTYIFEADNPWVIVGVLAVMISVSAWIAMRPLPAMGVRLYAVVLAALGSTGLAVFVLVTQFVLGVGRWFEPSLVVPIAGMIFSNSMNTVSLTAERFEAELGHGVPRNEARRAALDAALIPQINMLLAVGLVALPGMMTGQILAGVDPLVAARYQIVVMCMLFGAGGLAAALYLTMQRERLPACTD
ncbi:MAG: ABC transporter permease [Gammaproteobacteria bacterium]|nr:ABC transporter permease [Gammaproteobacteria bacterium]MDE0366922.1 ABC transporter permease [Gammaproteobacteria bacterium]